nr:hypothetical protein [Tanacetum cinerariifolium]
MATLTFADTYNMIAFLTKSDTSDGFDQIVDFLNAHTIQYALMVNPPIFVSCIKQFWALVSIKKSNDVVKLQALIVRKKELGEEEEIQVFWFKEVKEGVGGIVELDADEDITLVDVDADIQGRMEEDITDVKDINAAESEPTVFDDEEVTMTMAQTLIKIKVEKARILDEQMAKRLQYKEIEQAAAREKHEKEDLERAKVLQQQYDQKQESIDWNVVAEQMQKKHLDNIKKYQSLKRKPISVAQARKNMVVYLKNMVGYKIQHFKGMTYD